MTGSDRELQGLTEGYKKGTEGYKRLHGVTRGYSGFQEVTGS